CPFPLETQACIESEEDFRARAQTYLKQPFDLACGPLNRAKLFAMGPEHHVLVFAVHHILCDGWSLAEVLVREVATLYAAFAAGQSSPLPELPIQYADYAYWQRRGL